MLEEENSPYKPGTYNFHSIVEGDTWSGASLSFVENGEPLDLTGSTVTLTFRAGSKIGPVKMILSSNNPEDVVLEDNTVHIQEKNLTLEAATYVYDLKIVFPSGVRRTYLEGRFKILRDVGE